MKIDSNTVADSPSSPSHSASGSHGTASAPSCIGSVFPAPAHGAFFKGSHTLFSVWAPRLKELTIHVEGQGDFPMERRQDGFFTLTLDAAIAGDGARYGYLVPGLDRPAPDPASRYQPDGVNGLSQVVSLEFDFRNDGFPGVPPGDLAIQEIHVGTFTPGGTLRDAMGELSRLKDLGVNCVELMPLAAFDGQRGWGYDGVQPYAIHSGYGRPEDLAAFVDAAHGLGISVILDVVYNHFGPSGFYGEFYAPYFAPPSKATPWGRSLDYSRRPLRRYFIDNALYWLSTFHLDGLRLDAVHAIRDESSPTHILQELSSSVRDHHPFRKGALSPILIGESHLNDAMDVTQVERGGKGLSSQWSDDFHHALHAHLTGERLGYYGDFGGIDLLARALRDGQAYCGDYSQVWKGPRGTSTEGLQGHNFVIFTQNHDQVGNRAAGERLASLVEFRELLLAAGAMILAPCIPMLFMGEEWGETAPFLYFTDFPDQGLGTAVTQGRRREMQRFGWKKEAPDPQDIATCRRCVIHPEMRLNGRGRSLWNWYRCLLALRKSMGGFADVPVGSHPHQGLQVNLERNAISIRRTIQGRRTVLFLNFGKEEESVRLEEGRWRIMADSAPLVAADEGDERDEGGAVAEPATPWNMVQTAPMLRFPQHHTQAQASSGHEGELKLLPCQVLFLAEDSQESSPSQT